MIRFVRAGAFCVMKYAARHIIKCHWLAAEIGCICSLARLIDGKYEFRCLNSVEIIRKERKKKSSKFVSFGIELEAKFKSKIYFNWLLIYLPYQTMLNFKLFFKF